MKNIVLIVLLTLTVFCYGIQPERETGTWKVVLSKAQKQQKKKQEKEEARRKKRQASRLVILAEYYQASVH